MAEKRFAVIFTGSVQGVGFRFNARAVATGFEVAGAVRNLADGRVELVAEGERAELTAFREAIRDSGMERFIRDEAVTWEPARGGFRGFEVVS